MPLISNRRRATHGALPVLLMLLLVLLMAQIPAAQAFFNFGGTGGNRVPPPPQRPPDVDYYGVLELDSRLAGSITERQIKQQYRILSRKYHPDTAGGSSSADAREKYTSIQRAYEILSDKEKRKMFDILGEKGLEILAQHQRTKEHGGVGGPAGQHPFAGFFGNLVGGPELKAATVEREMRVSLQDVYNGATRLYHYPKPCVCSACKGTGAPLTNQKQKKCPHCHGQGAVISRVQIAPGMFQQIQQPCSHCMGEGKVYVETCPQCGGRRVLSKQRGVSVDIPKGVPDGHLLRLEMEGDEAIDKVPGDLILRMVTLPHSRFSRRKGGSDLNAGITVTLKEALLGFSSDVTHLDGVRKVAVRREGVLTPFDTEMRLAGEGLPLFEDPRGKHGDLYVTVTVQLPDKLTAAQREAIEKTF